MGTRSDYYIKDGLIPDYLELLAEEITRRGLIPKLQGEC